MSMDQIKIGKYEHYKGNHYEVIGLAKYSDTLEEMVIYKQRYGDGGLWVRPLQMFFEDIEIDGKKVLRFKYVDS